MSDHEAVVDAVGELLNRLEADDEVAFAEAGGVVREKTDVVVTGDGPRSTTTISDARVWCRAFADGAAAYRHTDDFSADGLDDLHDRVVAGGKYLAQDQPARVDVASLHRGTHSGWAAEPVTAVDEAEKRDCVADAVDGITANRLRAEYADERVSLSLSTTTGTAVHTTLDRAGLELTIDPGDGQTVRRHAGSTRGARFLDRIPDVVDDAAADADAARTAGESIVGGDGLTEDATGDGTEGATGDVTVALSPRAAGQLFHHITGYLAADVALFGFSPHDPGDTIAPETLTIDDGIPAGSWAARAYDAEGRPTSSTRLVDRGTVSSYLHDTSTAAEFGASPTGSVVPSFGFEAAPRIHHRHLDVAAGSHDPATLRADADAYVRRFGRPWFHDEFERTQRSGTMPPSSLYARDVAEKMGDRPDAGAFDLPIAEGFTLEGGDLAGAIDASFRCTPAILHGIDGVGSVRDTVTGVAEKHKSRLPWAVTAPGLRIDAELV